MTRLHSAISNTQREPDGGNSLPASRRRTVNLTIHRTNLHIIGHRVAGAPVARRCRVFAAQIRAVSAWAATSAFVANISDMRTRGSYHKTSVTRVATGAILSALCWLLIMLAAVLPTGKFFVLTLASLVIVVAARETGDCGAGLVYLVTTVLAFISTGIFMGTLFALCFGIQPLVIVFLRGRINPIVTRIITHLFMSGLFLFVIFLVGIDRLLVRDTRLSSLVITGLALLALQLFLFIYHYILRYFERFYEERIAPWIHRQ